MNIEAVFNTLVFLGVAIFMIDQLVFKFFVLRELRLKHSKIWIEMDSPTVFSSKESMWSLIGLSSSFDVLSNVRKDNASEQTINLLLRYKYFAYFDMALIFIVIIVALLK